MLNSPLQTNGLLYSTVQIQLLYALGNQNICVMHFIVITAAAWK